jgi:hypothetical protein
MVFSFIAGLLKEGAMGKTLYPIMQCIRSGEEQTYVSSII